MNKLFLIYIAFNLAVAYAQPSNESNLAKLPKEQRQCAANKMMLQTLSKLMEADKRGEGNYAFVKSNLDFKVSNERS